MKTASEILKEALGEIRYRLNGSVTNSQIEWAMEAYHTQFENKWVSVDERLPEEYTRCLIRKEDGALLCYATAIYSGKKFRFDATSFGDILPMNILEKVSDRIINGVAHWQEIKTPSNP